MKHDTNFAQITLKNIKRKSMGKTQFRINAKINIDKLSGSIALLSREKKLR